MTEYLSNSIAWSVAWTTVGYLIGRAEMTYTRRKDNDRT
jgi:hypothetical protein